MAASLVKVEIAQDSAWDAAVDLLAIGLFENEPLTGVLKEVDARLGGVIQDALSRNECKGEWLASWDTATLGMMRPRRLLVVGLGEKGEFDLRRLRLAAGFSAQKARDVRATALAWSVPPLTADASDMADVMTDGIIVGTWRFAKYSRDSDGYALQEAQLFDLPPGGQPGLSRGQVLAHAENYVRELGMRPSNKLYPQLMAEEALKTGREHGFEVEVFDEKKLAAMGMEAILGVGSGSEHPPRLVAMRYHGGGNRTLALVGKGITFDSGGISLKIPAGMEEMKFDMLGAGAVIGAMRAIAELKIPLNVVGIVALAQNIPSGTSIKPGDVVKAFNGKTIEVINTDAEGRVVLADAVSYAADLRVDWIVEASTLTGAALTVLGHEATALVAADDGLASLVLQASEASCERVWRLPIYPEYKRLYRSNTADIKNSPGRDAGTITGGMIIAEFAGETPYAHLDIAGTAWTPTSPLNGTKNGPTGVMVRTFAKLAEILSH